MKETKIVEWCGNFSIFVGIFFSGEDQIQWPALGPEMRSPVFVPRTMALTNFEMWKIPKHPQKIENCLLGLERKKTDSQSWKKTPSLQVFWRPMCQEPILRPGDLDQTFQGIQDRAEKHGAHVQILSRSPWRLVNLKLRFVVFPPRGFFLDVNY